MGRKRKEETIMRSKNTLHYYSTKEGQIVTWSYHIEYGDPYYNYDSKEGNLIYLGEFKNAYDFVASLARKKMICDCMSGKNLGWDAKYLSTKLCLPVETIEKIRKENTYGNKKTTR